MEKPEVQYGVLVEFDDKRNVLDPETLERIIQSCLPNAHVGVWLHDD